MNDMLTDRRREMYPDYRWVILVLLFAATTVQYLDRIVLGNVATTVKIDLGISDQQYGYIVSAVSAGYAVGLLLAAGLLIRLGLAPSNARKMVMCACALCMPLSALAVYANRPWVAILLISLANAAHNGWSANMFTLVGDCFKPSAVGSVTGLIGFAGGLGGILIAGLASGFIIEHFGYVPWAPSTRPPCFSSTSSSSRANPPIRDITALETPLKRRFLCDIRSISAVSWPPACSVCRASGEKMSRITHRERVLAAVRHQQPDRIPFDLGSTLVTGITRGAYLRLAEALKIDPGPVELCDTIQQLPYVSDNILEALGADTRGLIPNFGRKRPDVQKNGETEWFVDEWSVRWERPAGALYFSIAQSPLAQEHAIDSIPWPDPAADALFDGLAERARRCHEAGYAIILESLCAGVFEMCCRVRGTEMFMMDLVMQPEYACTLMDRFVSLKIAYYESAARRFGRYVNFIREVDDIAGQQNMLISPQMYRDLLKPRHKALFDAQTRLFGTDDFFIWFHSDGAVREILPDMLEIGMNVLNPVQTSAFGMDAAGLKRDFGQNCAFWGGGADTQHVLPHSSPENVRDHVKNAVSALSRGGGYVFGTVHNIQDDVPTENILAMLEAFNEVRNYN